MSTDCKTTSSTSTVSDKNGTVIEPGDIVVITIENPVEIIAEPVRMVSLEQQESIRWDRDLPIIITNPDDRDQNLTELIVQQPPIDAEPISTTAPWSGTVIYYPLTQEGLQVAQYDSGVEIDTFHRQQEYKATNITTDSMEVVSSSYLNPIQRDYYNQMEDLSTGEYDSSFSTDFSIY